MNTNKKLLVALAASAAISSVSAATCTGQALVTQSGLLDKNTVSSSSATETSVKFCSNLVKNSAQICCTPDTINSFQTKTDEYGAALTEGVSGRDRLLKVAYGTISNAQAIGEDYAVAIASALQKVGSNPNSEDFAFLTSLNKIFTGAAGQANGYLTTLTDLNVTVQDFQKSRSTCAIALLKLQGAVWCLSCNPAASTNGFDTTTETVTLSADAQNRIADACYDYVKNSELTNTLFQAYNLIGGLQLLTDAINANSDNLTNIENYLDQRRDQFEEDYNGFVYGTVPQACGTSEASCKTWIKANLFYPEGKINDAAFLAGGSVPNSGFVDDSEDVDSGSDSVRRVLAGTYSPTADEAGTNPTFQDDPSNFNSGVLGFGSVAAAVMMVTGAMML